MRARKEIILDALGRENEVLPRGSEIQLRQLEVLLDIRDLLTPESADSTTEKRDE